VFTKFIKLGDSIPHYPIYLLLGIVLWQFFSDITNQGLGSIVGRGDLIRKIKIPRWMIVLSTSISAMINLGLNLIVIAIFVMFSGIDVQPAAILFPFALIEIYIFGAGIALFLSAAFVKYRDISFVWEVFLQAGFYLTPILYPLSIITNINLQKLLLLNPMAQAIQDSRNVLVTQETITTAEVFSNPYARLIPIAISVIILVLGALYFRKQSKHFAENL